VLEQAAVGVSGNATDIALMTSSGRRAQKKTERKEGGEGSGGQRKRRKKSRRQWESMITQPILRL
jgi:hypothetical protein